MRVRVVGCRVVGFGFWGLYCINGLGFGSNFRLRMLLHFARRKPTPTNSQALNPKPKPSMPPRI